MKSLLKVLAVVALGVSVYAIANSDIESRISPVGEVCMAGDPCAAAAVASVSGPAEPRSGQAVYDAGCAMCHASGAGGAPKYGDAAAWSARIAQGKETLVSHAINGIGTMPGKGLCMDCSDEEIAGAVELMMSAAQ